MSIPSGELLSHEPLQPGITAEEEAKYNDYIERNGINKEQVEVWLEAITSFTAARPQTFEGYTDNLHDAVAVGNNLVAAKQATGFNIIENEDYFPIAASEPLIIYSMSVRRRLHIAILLAEMQVRGIITPDQIEFGGKASAVKFGNWENDPRDEIIKPVTITQAGLSNEPEIINFGHTTEVCVIFTPRDIAQAAEISDFLFKKVFLKDDADYIPESWVVPDIRATSSLKELVNNPVLTDKNGKAGYEIVSTNLLSFPISQLLVMRQEKVFNPNEGWQNTQHPINQELFMYLKVET